MSSLATLGGVRISEPRFSVPTQPDREPLQTNPRGGSEKRISASTKNR